MIIHLPIFFKSFNILFTLNSLEAIFPKATESMEWIVTLLKTEYIY